jgi:hypothetical protein
MSDLDGIVELGGHFLLVEWKKPGVAIPDGQRIMFEKMTQNEKFIVYLVTGDPKAMTVEKREICYGGKFHASKQLTLGDLKDEFKRWSKMAAPSRLLESFA